MHDVVCVGAGLIGGVTSALIKKSSHLPRATRVLLLDSAKRPNFESQASTLRSAKTLCRDYCLTISDVDKSVRAIFLISCCCQLSGKLSVSRNLLDRNFIFGF